MEVFDSTLEERDALIMNVELIMLGICFSPIILLILYPIIKMTISAILNPKHSLRSGLLKIITLPVAYIYFRKKFGKRFFKKPSVCEECQVQFVNGLCPECNVMISVPWNRYIGGADMWMIEFAKYENDSIKRGETVLANRKKNPNQSAKPKNTVHEPPIDLTSGLFED
jgi:hypothetical protein